MKHTPGPWTNQVLRTDCGVVFKIGPFPWKDGKLNHACIYADYPSSKENAECAANARLIAAAPDLLFHLLAASNYIDALGGDSKSYRAAIAKATGAA